MNTKEYKVGDQIEISAGTELNGGVHEDGECFLVYSNTQAVVVGIIDSALGVQIEGMDTIVFFHQPYVPEASQS